MNIRNFSLTRDSTQRRSSEAIVTRRIGGACCSPSIVISATTGPVCLAHVGLREIRRVVGVEEQLDLERPLPAVDVLHDRRPEPGHGLHGERVLVVDRVLLGVVVDGQDVPALDRDVELLEWHQNCPKRSRWAVMRRSICATTRSVSASRLSSGSGAVPAWRVEAGAPPPGRATPAGAAAAAAAGAGVQRRTIAAGGAGTGAVGAAERRTHALGRRRLGRGHGHREGAQRRRRVLHAPVRRHDVLEGRADGGAGRGGGRAAWAGRHRQDERRAGGAARARRAGGAVEALDAVRGHQAGAHDVALGVRRHREGHRRGRNAQAMVLMTCS